MAKTAPNSGHANLRPFSKDDNRASLAGQTSSNKGKKHITTWIQELMEDEDFEANILDPKVGIKEYKGAPVKAIVSVAITKAVNGDSKAMDLLMKYGWTQKQEIEHTGTLVTGTVSEDKAKDFSEFLKNNSKK